MLKQFRLIPRLFRPAPQSTPAVMPVHPAEVPGDYVLTIRGVLPKSSMFRRVGMHEDENEIATWQEWWMRPSEADPKPVMVQRDAQVQLKHWPDGAIEAGMVAGYPAGTKLKEKTA